eukprot:m51a1_g13672 putative severin kinase (169) ;mRNA; f:647-1712
MADLKSRRTGETVAIKVVDVSADDEDAATVVRDVEGLARVASPYLVRYYGASLVDSAVWIAMEYFAGGSALDLMRTGNGRLEEPCIALILKETIKALEFLHGENRIHRDIKAANIMLTGSGEVKLGDYGALGQLSDVTQKRNTLTSGPSASPPSRWPRATPPTPTSPS